MFNQYYKIEKKNCKYVMGGFSSSIGVAKQACDAQDDCIAIEDLYCTKSYFRMCKKASTITTSTARTCVHQKIQGKFSKLELFSSIFIAL